MLPRLTLSQRFALLIFSVGLVLVIPLVSLQTHSARRALQHRVQSSSEVIVDALVGLCRAHLSDRNVGQLRSELQSILQLSHIVYIDVFTASGKTLIQVIHPEYSRGHTLESHIESVHDDVLDLTREFTERDPLFGSVKVGIWVKGVDRDAAKIARNGLWMGLTLCACLAIISWVMGRWLASRLQRFAENMATQAAQDFRHFDLRGADEVSALVSAFNERQDRLKEAQEQRARAERERQDMTHMIIHDLKGPLGGFAAGLDLLKESITASGDSSEIQLLQLMERATERLLRMTQSILQVNRLEDEHFPMQQAPVDIQALLCQRVDETQILAKELGITLRILVPNGPALSVLGDADLLGRVIDNLVFNALEHTPHDGTVTLSIQVNAQDVRIEVGDSGPGIPPDEREKIFEKFQKGHQPSRGVGLGLAFCKLAVERHGGRIGVGEPTGGGALFYFTLPLSLAAGIGRLPFKNLPPVPLRKSK